MKDIADQSSSRNRVLSHLRTGISDGTYPAGGRLPSERELSQLLGVARPTVNRVLNFLENEGLICSNGGRLRLVSQRGLEARRNGLPQALKNTVVVVSLSPSGSSSHHRRRGWADWIVQGVFDEVSRQRLHHMAFEPSHLGGEEWEHILEIMPYGVISTDLLGKWGEAWDEASQRAIVWKERGLAVVSYGNAPDVQAFDRVSSDHEIGGYLLTQALLEMGRKHILMIGELPPEPYWLSERYRGYSRAMQEFGLAPLPLLQLPQLPHVNNVQTTFDIAYRHLAGHLAPYVIASKLDALIAPSDGAVPTTIAACRSLSQVPNKDIIVAGYDNYWEEAPERAFENEPPLFSIDKRNTLMGKELVRLLSDRVQGKLAPEPQKRLIAPLLKRRVK